MYGDHNRAHLPMHCLPKAAVQADERPRDRVRGPRGLGMRPGTCSSVPAGLAVAGSRVFDEVRAALDMRRGSERHIAPHDPLLGAVRSEDLVQDYIRVGRRITIVPLDAGLLGTSQHQTSS